MDGRKYALPPTTVIYTIIQFKDRMVGKSDTSKKIKPAYEFVLCYFNTTNIFVHS